MLTTKKGKTMRTIKYKGKGNPKYNDGKWYFGFLRIDADGDYQIMPYPNCYLTVLSDSVSEFTGEFDINNSEIYENDILWDARNEEYCYIKYEEGGFWVVEDNVCWEMQECDMKEFEVVGTLFENSELIGD